MTDERDTPRRDRAPLILRNLRQTPYHMRLGDPEKPYRVQLAPRGTAGDIRNVPAKFDSDDALVTAYNLGIIEVITEAEARAAASQYRGAGSVRRRIPVVRPEDTSVTVGRISHDAKGNPVMSRVEESEQSNERMQRMSDATTVRGAGPNVVGSGGGTGIAGADDGLAEKFQEAEREASGLSPQTSDVAAVVDHLSPELREAVLRELDELPRGEDGQTEELPPREVDYRDDEPAMEGRRPQLSDEEIAEHQRTVARLAAESDFEAAEARRQAELVEKGVLPEGVLKPKVRVIRSNEQPGAQGIEDPTHWSKSPGARPPER